MHKTLVSVAMCTYNGEKYIREQLDSILNQTHTNIELIITDDFSTDGTVEIIKEYSDKDSRISFYKNEKNIGFLKNFEKAISLCTGEYIALTDQDDIWKINKLEIFLNEIKENVLIYSDAILIDKDSKEIGQELIRPGSCLCSGKCNKAFFLTNFVSGNTMMFKKELIKYILPIPNKMSYHDIWIAFVASTYGTITYTEEPMTYYRRYSEQVTHVEKKEHKNFFEKLKYKQEERMKVAQIRAQDLEVFKSLSILKDEETLKIINLLLEHFNNYQNAYFNIQLYKILKKNTSEVFAGFRPSKRRKRAFRNAVGLKLRTLTLFMV